MFNKFFAGKRPSDLGLNRARVERIRNAFDAY